MFRGLSATLLVVLAITGCEKQASRDAHDKTLVAGAKQEERAELEKLTATQAAAEAELKATADRAAADKKTAEDRVAAQTAASLRADVQAHPEKYVEFTGLEFARRQPKQPGELSDNRIPLGERHVIRVYGTNKSPYTVRITEASVIAMDSSGQESATAPLSLNGSIAPGQTKTFQEAGIRSGVIPGQGRSARVYVTAVEIIDVAKVAIQ